MMNPTDQISINVVLTVIINTAFSGSWHDIKQEATGYLNQFSWKQPILLLFHSMLQLSEM